MVKSHPALIRYLDKAMRPTDREHAYWQEEPKLIDGHITMALSKVDPKTK